MACRTVQRPRLIQEHLRDQVLPTTEKDVGNGILLLNNAPQPPLHAVILILRMCCTSSNTTATFFLPWAAIFAGAISTSSISGSRALSLLTPKVTLGLPSESTVTLGTRCVNRRLAVSSSCSALRPIDSVIALAVAVTNETSPSVAHKST